MAIETTIAPRQKWWNLIYLVLCLGLGLWGLYDYAVKIPRQEADFARYTAASTRYQELEAIAEQAGALDEAQRRELAVVEAELQSFEGRVPEQPAAWDRPVQLWLYIVGCGVLGVPYFAWNLWSLSRRTYRLDDDGTLVFPGGRWPADTIVDIDMSRWMARSIAWVENRGGERVLLDDYKFRNTHLIVGALAQRFHPDDWTEEAKVRKAPDDAVTEPAATEPVDVVDGAGNGS